MTVTINGTTGVSGVAGSASTPALIGSDADSGYYINSANEPNASVNGTAVWSAASTFGFKNRIINGRMDIDQRNAGASLTPTDGAYSLDRWRFQVSQASKLTVQQRNSVDSGASNYEAGSAPSGYANSMKVTSSSAYSSLSTDYFWTVQFLEGFNTQDLAWGTASAKTITLSFWVKSSLTGAFGGALASYTGSTRTYPFSFTISSANTWEQKTITIAGDTSGTYPANNNGSIGVYFNLGTGSNRQGTANVWSSSDYRGGATGSTSVVGTNGATFYITGVQFEVGSTATSFDFRSYGTELALCQRYYCSSFPDGTAAANGVTAALTGLFNAYGASNGWSQFYSFPVAMRATPTLTFYRSSSGVTNGQWATYDSGTWTSFTTTVNVSESPVTRLGFNIDGTRASAFTAKSAYLVSGNYTASAEL